MESDQNYWHRNEKTLGIRALKAWNRCYVSLVQQLTVKTPCPLPKTGPAILISNHVSSIDPLLIQSTSPRLIRWMMAREYFAVKSVRWVFSEVGVILVDRAGRDMAATRAALRALDDGYILGVFPEGRFAPTREFLPFQNGIGLLAIKSGAPLYPVLLETRQRGKGMVQAFVESARCNLTYGPRVELKLDGSHRQQIEAATRQIMQSVAVLRNCNC